ncbi:hypothetical protein DFH29DRAFT_877257 [Suillus ampliporus]|nr:hypothetical protein DFH29DRAFT_877257 [Suillus ampliporus]
MTALNDAKAADSDATNTIDDLPTFVPRHDLEKRLLRKLDLRMSIIVVIYTLNYIDRTNATCVMGCHTLTSLKLMTSTAMLGYKVLSKICVCRGNNTPRFCQSWCNISIDRWLFYIEGGIIMFIAICAMFILPDFPHNTKWLTPEERALAISRLAEDGDAALVVQLVAQSFYTYFPTLSATMGMIRQYSDKRQKRYRYIFASNAVTALGFIISICTMNTAARYVSLFLMVQVYAGYMVLWGWINNTFTGEPAKRTVAVALINGLSQIGNVIGSYVWQTNWGPTYRYSYAVCIATLRVSTGMFDCKERDANHNEKLGDAIGLIFSVVEEVFKESCVRGGLHKASTTA